MPKTVDKKADADIKVTGEEKEVEKAIKVSNRCFFLFARPILFLNTTLLCIASVVDQQSCQGSKEIFEKR
jgi:hypothetical protein